jgi:N-acetylmuramic acid 6-phosphate (MurNAc-6-P) etherase
MIKMGKVAGSYMVDMACINMKLIERAQVILKTLYHIDEEEAIQRLQKSDMNLYEAIQKLNNR